MQVEFYYVTDTHRKICYESGGITYSQEHELINYIDTKAKCRHLKILTCKGTAGVYQSLYTGDTVSHVGIFDPVW